MSRPFGIDTNVLLRIVVDDHAGQAAAARALTLSAPKSPIYINRVVICEAVWTLGRGYRFSRAEIADALDLWLDNDRLDIEDRAEVEKAAAMFRLSKADFADILIGLVNQRAGCTATYSFDEAGIAAGVFTAVPAA